MVICIYQKKPIFDKFLGEFGVRLDGFFVIVLLAEHSVLIGLLVFFGIFIVLIVFFWSPIA